MSIKVSAIQARARTPNVDEAEESSVVIGTASSESTSGSDDSPAPVMWAKPGTIIPPAQLKMSRRTRSLSVSEKPVATLPTVILRTESVKHGRRASFRIVTVSTGVDRVDPPAIPMEGFRKLAEASSDKRLRKQRDTAISNQGKVYVDVSQRWDNLNAAGGARVAPVRGLLAAAAGKKLTLDLSNHRAGLLREGARVRNETDVVTRDWSKALQDIEVGLVVESLAEEIAGLAKAPGQMPELTLICRDQPLSAAVYPLLKCLALHASTLTQFKQLDLSRTSRSGEVCEARPPTDKVLAKAYDKFADRISVLVMACPSLQSLGLRMNGVHSHALAALAHALSGNRCLRELDLSCNPLTTQASATLPSLVGVRALVRALRAGCTLETLDLSFCGLGKREADLLAQALTHNKVLAKINLGGNPIAPDHVIFKDKRVVRIANAKPDI